MLFPSCHRGFASCGVWGGRPLLQENHGKLPHARCPALPPAQASSPRPTHTGFFWTVRAGRGQLLLSPGVRPGVKVILSDSCQSRDSSRFPTRPGFFSGQGPPAGVPRRPPLSGPTVFLHSCCPGVAGALGRLLASVLPLGSICCAFAIRLGHVCLAGRQLTGAPVRGSRSGAVPPRGR